MFCKNCGAEIPDGSVFCGNCGMQTSVEQPRQEPVNQYSNTENNAYQSYQQPRYAQPEQPVYNSEPVYNAQPIQQASSLNPTLWIVLNAILIVIGCCRISGLLGIIGLAFAIQANNLMRAIQNDSITMRVSSNAYATQIQNEETRARNMGTVANRLKTAKILFFVGVGLFVVGIILMVIGGVAENLLNNPDYYYSRF